VSTTIILAVLASWALQAASAGEGPSMKARPRSGERWHRSVPNGKNEPAVKSAFQPALAGASAATVRILADGEEVALGAVVDAGGYAVTKASVLSGKLVCRFVNGATRDAQLVGANAAHDLALLRIAATNLPAVSWRDGDPPLPGSFVATTGALDEPVAIGVVSSEPRTISGPASPTRPRGWLGIGLGGGDSGTGVESVARDSPAAKAGFRSGDEVKRVEGVAMESADQIINTVRSFAPRQTIKVLVLRGDKELELSATLGKPRLTQGPQDHWGGGPFSERRTGFPLVLPHDTPLEPKDCGGPLVDTDGRVVGINIARALRVTTYALPGRVVRDAVQELKEKAAAEARPR
jgi:serine protease Do